MARSAAPGLPLPTAALLRDCGCRGPPDPEGYSSSSPAPSPDSCGLSSPAAARGPCHGPAVPRPRRGPGGRKGVRAAVAGGPRQSASEREKLRMRRLARALLRLRHYLPPALAPAGQSLTKIETLRLATRYIAHLSALLGLGQETPARRRGAAPRHCPLCPQGLGCCQPPHPPRHPPAPAPRDASPAGTAGWGSPPTAGTPLELRGAPGVGTEGWGSPPYSPAVGTPLEVFGLPGMAFEAWGSPPYGPAAGTPPDVPEIPDTGMGAWGSPPYFPAAGIPLEMSGVPDMGTGAWGSPPYPPVAGTPPELHGALDSEASSWLSPPGCAGAGAPPDLPGDPLLDAGLMLPELLDAGTVTQELSADLLSLLEALLPPQPQD